MWWCHVLNDAQDTDRTLCVSGKPKYTQNTEVKRAMSPCAAIQLIFKWTGKQHHERSQTTANILSKSGGRSCSST